MRKVKKKKDKPKKLTPKQKLFVKEYLVDFNASKAAIRAGYSEKTAFSIGVENLTKPLIKEAIKKEQESLCSRIEVTQEKIIEELAKIAFGNQTDIVRWDENGNVRLKPSDEIDKNADAAIAEIMQSITSGGINLKVKKFDKVKALELLMKHLGMMTEKVQIESAPEMEVKFTYPDDKTSD